MDMSMIFTVGLVPRNSVFTRNEATKPSGIAPRDQVLQNSGLLRSTRKDGRETTQAKKILYVITKSNWGGAQRYVFDMATNLPAEFTPVVAVGGNGELKNRLEEAGVRTIPIHAFQRDVNLLKDAASFFELITIFRREKPNVIHLNSSKAGAMGALTARIYRLFTQATQTKIIFTIHGLPQLEPRPMWQKKIITVIMRLTVRLIDTGIMLCNFERDMLATSTATSRKLITIYNGREPIPFLDKTTAAAALESITGTLLPMGKTIIGTIAELHRNKGLDVLLHALTHLPKAHVIIISDGEERAALASLARELHITTRVSFLGHIKNAAQYIKAFDVFVLPSRKEGFPYAILEAGQAELPVVVSAIGGIPEIISHNETGLLIEADNPAHLAHALQHYIRSPQKRTLHGLQLSKIIRAKFSLERMVSETIRTYTQK